MYTETFYTTFPCNVTVKRRQCRKVLLSECVQGLETTGIATQRLSCCLQQSISHAVAELMGFSSLLKRLSLSCLFSHELL